MKPYKVAGVQMDIAFADPLENLRRVRDRMVVAADKGANLVVFPECTTTGYCFDSFDTVRKLAEPRDGRVCTEVQAHCQRLGVSVVIGMLELAEDLVFNSAALIGPHGLVGTYRKIHLPVLGLDRYTTPGDGGFKTFEHDGLSIGLNICYDSAFPEAARSLALQGADLVVLPTNWPGTSSVTADHVPNTRALENHVYFLAINRIGIENGVEFIGKSKICDPLGHELDAANHPRETILFADVDPGLARRKHIVNLPGRHEIDRFKDRRPEYYGSLTRPVA
jgi:predicted amidohydrolase